MQEEQNAEQNLWSDKNLIKILKEGGVVVMPTDTLYGIVARAEDREAVGKIYQIRKRAPQKPCIILIGDQSELGKFSITLTEKQKNIFNENGSSSFSVAQGLRPTSIVLDCTDDKLEYLHRGTNTLAFRLSASKDLRDLLIEVGPLIAPSANPEGLTPAKNISEARNYFGEQVDLYVDGGEINREPSRVIRLHPDGSTSILRS